MTNSNETKTLAALERLTSSHKKLGEIYRDLSAVFTDPKASTREYLDASRKADKVWEAQVKTQAAISAIHAILDCDN